jgi:V/A-type H+-transporting ATPase subunit E
LTEIITKNTNNINMQNKLQELTEKLYAEGLSKGKQEGEEILAKAKVQADEIVAKAHAEAAAIVAAAKKDAEDLKTKVESDVKMAASQSVAATKKDIETLVVAKMTEAEVKNALTSADFVKEVIIAVAKGFNTEEPVDLEVVLPEALKKDLEGFVAKELANALKGNVEASFSKKVAGGFTIGPKDGGYFISFTDETFNALISEYLRPATKKLLFG